MAGIQKTYALLVGVVLGLAAVWGPFQSPILGLFGVNFPHNVLHLIAAGFGIYVGTKGEGPGYNVTIGWIGIVLFIFWFIPFTNNLLGAWLGTNLATSLLHLVVGVVSLGVYYLVKE